MIKGYIIFRWENGYEQTVSFLHNLKGLVHNSKRPLSYRVIMVPGAISEIEIFRLNRWLEQIPSVLRRQND